MHIAAYKLTVEVTLPGVKLLRDTLAKKSVDFKAIVTARRCRTMLQMENHAPLLTELLQTN